MSAGLSRRQLLKATGAGATAAAATKWHVPHIRAQSKKISIGVGNWAVESITEVLETLQFTQKTGIEVEVKQRSGVAADLITEMTGAIQSGNSPYDVLDFEDEIASTFSRAGFLLGIDDLLTPEVLGDFTPTMTSMADIWDKHEGETFRIHHNYEAQYWWYRKDLFDAKGVAVPTTWDEVAALGQVFTDEAAGVWATGDGLMKGGFLNVYIAWLTRQAGGDPFQADDHYKEALQYAYHLMHEVKALNPASLQQEYNALNQDYIADRIVCMRQWPYFYDVARAATEWYVDGKAEIALPPNGPAGVSGATYAAGWGWGIPKNASDVEAAKELVRFLVATENVPEMAKIDTWYLVARTSVLDATGDIGIAPHLKMYSDAGVITTRPFHEKFVEALGVVEDAASAFLSDQLSLDEAVEQTKSRLGSL